MSSLLNLFNIGARPAAHPDAAPAAQHAGWFADMSRRVANAIRAIPLFTPTEQHAPFPQQEMRDLLPNIFGFLPPDDLKNAALVCKRWGDASRDLVKQTHDAKTAIRFWNRHARQIVEAYRNDGIDPGILPNDGVIESHQLTIDEEITAAAAIYQWIAQVKAHDTLKVWRVLASRLQRDEDVPAFDATNAIEEASRFPAWMDAHREDLNNINQLDLSNLHLFTIPEEICSLTHLVYYLNLENNFLLFLPNSIGNLSMLRQLNLKKNCLTEIPPSIGQLSQLGSLEISENHLTSIPDTLLDLPCLSHLNLDVDNVHLLRASTIPTRMVGQFGLPVFTIEDQMGGSRLYESREIKRLLNPLVAPLLKRTTTVQALNAIVLAPYTLPPAVVAGGLVFVTTFLALKSLARRYIPEW